MDQAGNTQLEDLRPQEWARKFYNVSAEIKPLAGYQDINFKLVTGDKRRYLLKISARGTAKTTIEAQNEILQHLQDHSSRSEAFPQLIPGVNGSVIQIIHIDGEERFMRLLNYLEGSFLYEVPHSKSLLGDFGHFLGSMDSCLKDLQLPSLKSHRQSWDLQYAQDNSALVVAIVDPRYRRLATYFLQQHQFQVTPHYRSLPQSVIHGDANDHNVLVDNLKINGLIDFGDASYSHTIHELAVALTYILMGKKEPLQVTSEIVKSYHQALKLDGLELELLYYLINTRLAVSLCLSSYHWQESPRNEYLGLHQKPVKELMDTMIAINPLHFERQIKAACDLQPREFIATPDLRQLRDKYFSKALSVSYQKPLHIIQGAMQYLYDARGRSYLDGVNNICHVGHCHPKVVAAAAGQWARLNTNTRYLYDSLHQYAEQLLESLPEPMAVVFFVNSGSEANDLALRLARTHTGHKDMVVLESAYHGNSTATLEISPYKYRGKGGPGGQNFVHEAAMPDLYRGKYRANMVDALQGYIKEMGQLVEGIIQKQGGLAGFIAESLLGCGGQIVLPEGYLGAVYNIVRGAGGVCIADEVQVGFGRVGTHFWGFETQGVVPDIVTMGKPMGNGHPLAAVVTTAEIASSFQTGMEYFNSFGGNPVSCEIGKAVLQIIREEQLQEHALYIGDKILNDLKVLQSSHHLIGDVRGLGLFLGVEMVTNRETREPATHEAAQLVEHMKGRGILLSTDGPSNNVIKFKPPMVFTEKNADYLLENLNEVLLSLAH